ncbi:MAG: SIS domain-containing protein [Brevinema sp.]
MWKDILNNSTDTRYVHTLKEILHQPECWKKTGEIVLEDKELELFFMKAIQDESKPIIVSGAGSSEFAGKSVIDTLGKNLNRRIINAPTTDIVTHPEKFSIPTPPSLMISFARSGNSPESLASVKLLRQYSPSTKHLIITCNKKGSLAQIQDDHIYCVILPEETNDESLVMTSSFSSMILAAVLCSYFSKKNEAYQAIKSTGMCVERFLNLQAEQLYQLMNVLDIERIEYLGSSDAVGLQTEGHLKILEMTDGKIATRVDSFLGLRHGPQVFINSHTVVVAILSNDPYVRTYEIDLLNELKTKQQGYAYIVIGKNPEEVILPRLISCDTGDQNDFFKLLSAVVIVQLVGVFKSLNLGLSPDAPSISGTINRVVQGVEIYPYPK